MFVGVSGSIINVSQVVIPNSVRDIYHWAEVNILRAGVSLIGSFLVDLPILCSDFDWTNIFVHHALYTSFVHAGLLVWFN